MLTGALIGPVFAPTQEETPVLRLVWLPAYAAILGMTAYRLDRVWRAWPGAIAVLLIIGLAYASKFWSIDSGVTSRRVIALALSGVFALYLGSAFRGVHLPRLLTWATLIMAMGSLVMVFAFPSIGVHQFDNAGLWRGLWYEKNQMGAVMVIGATAAAATFLSPDRNKLVSIAAFGLSSMLVLATQSKTSLLCLVVGLSLVGGFWVLRRGGPAFSVAAVWVAVVLAASGIWLWETHSVDILEALGKDPSLTGRTQIWAALMDKVADRPWTGYGYGAFWGKESVPAEWVRMETRWPVPSAHNGWIDLLVQLGWPGAILVGTLMLLTTVVTVMRCGVAGLREGWWAMGFLGAFFVLSLSESILLTHQSLPWVLFLAVMTRAMLPSSTAQTAPLAARVRRAYQTPPRIAAQYRHGSPRRAFPVR
ncbi:MAG: O-antigen ligase family protein [Brevundimonas sp.]|nr:MAG: O-antigen ligase family protein [Brevundimonas sp.]